MVASVVVLPLPVGPVMTIMPCGKREQPLQPPSSRLDRPSLLNSSKPAVARQKRHRGALAVLRRHGGDANVDFRAADAQPRRAVLRQAAARRC